MKREFSAGGIVFNDKGQVLVTQHSQNKHWSFPKGLLDHPEQTMEESALREVREEGGVQAEIVGKVGYSKYVYHFNDEKVFKVVTYFLMKYISGDIKDHDWEVSDIGWFEPEEALKQLTFSQDKSLLRKALEMKGVSS
ncbi:NUDIX domain-containing protein [Candidatus Daviesbacteria bacterium]|nr:NUDIX domain-containing protein [Candidatus Daviesbacteria bacterium]